MDGHHLVMGTCNDFLTGEELPDTHDERYRQKLARLLVENGGFRREEIQPRFEYRFTVEGRSARIVVDFVITIAGRIAMVVRYAPGSLVTRHRPALAVSRVLAPYPIPVAVVTNGEKADVLDGLTGRITASGLESIPTRAEMAARATGPEPVPVDAQTKQMAHRILYAFEIHGSCNCETDPCDLR